MEKSTARFVNIIFKRNLNYHMAKKMTKTAEKKEKQQQDARLAAINEFNRSNMGESWIDPDREPTDEEIAQAKKDFEDRTLALQNKNDYLIADKENALRVAKFIRDFIANGFWAQRYFVGVINFVDFIDGFIKECEAEPKDLTMEYGPMQFCYLMFENYAGFGYESAKRMAEMWDDYVPIFDILRDHVEYYNAEAKECEKLKQRWGMLSQGYYLIYLNPEETSSEVSTPQNTGESTDNSDAVSSEESKE